MKLTATTIRALTLPPGKSDKTFFDDDLPGFGLRLRSSGAARWVVQYDIVGPSTGVGEDRKERHTRRVTLGTTALLNAGEARDKAKDLLAGIRLGSDPAAEKREARRRATETFGALLPRYLAYQRGRRRPRSYRHQEGHLVRYARELHPHPLTAIDRRAIAKLISALTEENGPATAKCVRASLAQYFTWLQREGLLDGTNPVAHTNTPVTNAARSRLISDEELRKIWGALSDDDYSDIVRLLVYTGARRDEIGGLQRDEVDLKAAEIRLPKERCKNKRPHTIALSEPALAVLAQRPRERAYVFGFGALGFQGWSHRKKVLDARSGVTGWTLHDLRRLISTTMHDQLGIAPHVVEAVLAHVGHQRGTPGIYNKALYLDERRRALERWAEYVTGVVTGKPAKAKVVNLRKR
jgi:integrase